jgi:hypothetical protein
MTKIDFYFFPVHFPSCFFYKSWISTFTLLEAAAATTINVNKQKQLSGFANKSKIMFAANLGRLFSNLSLQTSKVLTSTLPQMSGAPSLVQKVISRANSGEPAGSPFWPKFDRLLTCHLKGPVVKKRPNKNPLGVGVGRAKGTVIR